MLSFPKNTATWAALFAAAAVAGAAATPMSRVSVSFGAAPAAQATIAKTVAAAAAGAAIQPAATVARLATAPVVQRPLSEQALRQQMKFETVRWGGKPVRTLDEASRLLLAKAAAQHAGLHEVGLGFQDVYGVIDAETSWIPRTGSSKDGTPNLGLAQFEPRTARGLGVKDPGDPVQAVFGAAKYMKQGATWAADRLAALELPPAQHAAKVREGVSVFYNLSVKGRNKWDGLNSAKLPVETQRHIRNAREGAAEAAQLARRLLRA